MGKEMIIMEEIINYVKPELVVVTGVWDSPGPLSYDA